MPSFSCKVEEAITNELRLDRYIAEYLKILSRSQIKARKLEAKLNGKIVKVSRILQGGEQLELSWEEAESIFLIPEKLDLDVIYEDARVIVVNKTQGMVVHPGAGNRQGTLANALLYRSLAKKRSDGSCGNTCDFTDNQGGLRPGIVHRLDKDTSGVIIAAWDEEAHAFLAQQFKERKVRKSYAAIVQGCPKEKSGCIEKKIVRSRKDRKTFTVSETEGRPSVTYYKVVRSWKNYSLLLLRPKTGRTHQLRVHLKYLGYPILGDPIYGQPDSRFKKATLMLHAKSLAIVLPSELYDGSANPAEAGMKVFKTPLPERFHKIIKNIRV